MPVTQHDIDTLRLVGRLGVASGRALHPLICPEAHVATRNRRLQRLVDSGLLWRDSTPHPNRDTIGRPLGRSLAVYGLTRRGWEILDIQGVESESTYARLIARPDDAPTPADGGTLAYDVAVSDWLIDLIGQIRTIPALAGMHVQRSYAIMGDNDDVVATIGALVTLALDPTRPSPPSQGPIPWLGGDGRVLNWVHHWLAIEIDSALDDRQTLENQAARYHQLAARRYAGQIHDNVERCVQVRLVLSALDDPLPGSPTS